MGSSTDGRLLVIDARHHSAWLWIVNIVGIVLISFSAIYRVMQRWKIWNRDSIDDHFAALAFVCLLVLAIIHFSIQLVGVRLGLGEVDASTHTAPILQAAKYAFASRVLCAATACASQCSVLMTLKRIVQVRRDSWITLLATLFSCLCFLVILLTLTVECSSQSVISGIRGGACSSPEPRLIVVAVLEAVNEVLPFGLAFYFIWQLQMPLPQRWSAIIGYACRMSNVILIAVSTLYSVKFVRADRNSLDIVTAFVIQAILVISEFLSVVAIYLARAMNEFQTAGPAITLSSAKDYGSKGESKGFTSINLKSLRGDTEGVRNRITHVERRDSTSSQDGIIKTVEFEISADAESGSREIHGSNSSRDLSTQMQRSDDLETP